jgi:hypothetical protein
MVRILAKAASGVAARGWWREERRGEGQGSVWALCSQLFINLIFSLETKITGVSLGSQTQEGILTSVCKNTSRTGSAQGQVRPGLPGEVNSGFWTEGVLGIFVYHVMPYLQSFQGEERLFTGPCQLSLRPMFSCPDPCELLLWHS